MLLCCYFVVAYAIGLLEFFIIGSTVKVLRSCCFSVQVRTLADKLSIHILIYSNACTHAHVCRVDTTLYNTWLLMLGCITSCPVLIRQPVCFARRWGWWEKEYSYGSPPYTRKPGYWMLPVYPAGPVITTCKHIVFKVNRWAFSRPIHRHRPDLSLKPSTYSRQVREWNLSDALSLWRNICKLNCIFLNPTMHWAHSSTKLNNSNTGVNYEQCKFLLGSNCKLLKCIGLEW